MRTQNMVNARKAARQCFVNAKAPDGTPCADPWTNLGQGRRATDIGTCGYLKCHSQVLAWYAAEGDTESGDNEQFNHNSACAQTVHQAFYTAAANNLIPCSLPGAWRDLGWSCNTESGSGGGSGNGAGIAFGILIPLALVGGVAFMIKTGKGPRWFHNGVDKIASKFKSGGGYKNFGTSTSTASAAYGGVGSAYSYTTSAGYGSGTGSSL